MNDNIDKNEIRKAIDRLQLDHPCHFAFDATKFDSTDNVDVVKRVIDNVMESIRDDADIHIICEMAKLYLDGVKPAIEQKRTQGEWRECEVKNIFGEKMKAYECSNCENKNIGDIWIMCKLSFCPHCGADMREVGEAE